VAPASQPVVRTSDDASYLLPVIERDDSRRANRECRFGGEALADSWTYRAATPREEQALVGHELKGMVGSTRAILEAGALR